MKYYRYGNQLRKMSDMLHEMEKEISDEIILSKSAPFSNRVQKKTYTAGSLIFAPGEPSCEQIYVLKKGHVDLYRLTESGKRLLLGQVPVGTAFNFKGLIGRKAQGNFAEAIEDSIIYSVDAIDVLTYLKQNPKLLMRLLEHLIYSLTDCEERLLRSMYNPTIVKIAGFLLTNATSDTGVIVNFTHEEIGNAIGITRQTTTRYLNTLHKQGLIEVDWKRIRILDRGGIEKIISEWLL